MVRGDEKVGRGRGDRALLRKGGGCNLADRAYTDASDMPLFISTTTTRPTYVGRWMLLAAVAPKLQQRLGSTFRSYRCWTSLPLSSFPNPVLTHDPRTHPQVNHAKGRQ